MRRVTQPAVEPVTLVDVKDHLRIDGDTEDAHLERLITTARERLEDHTGRAFITQTWEGTFDNPYSNRLRLPRPEIQSIVSVVDEDDGAIQYQFKKGILILDVPRHGVTVRWVAGYGDAADNVPMSLRIAILEMVGVLYENREGQAGIPDGVNDLIAGEMVVYL